MSVGWVWSHHWATALAPPLLVLAWNFSVFCSMDREVSDQSRTWSTVKTGYENILVYRGYFFLKTPLQLIFWKNRNSILPRIQFCRVLGSLYHANSKTWMCKCAYCKTTNGYILDLRSWVCTPICYCQCKISLPTQVYMFSIRRSRLYTSVCTIHVSMSCVAYRCTDPGP